VNINIALFGIAREIVGQPSLSLTAPEGQSAAGLLAELRRTYPDLAGLRSLAVAVNNEYADDVVLHERDEIALIPPVSGG
jgi:molybdopterin converting factor small subunit